MRLQIRAERGVTMLQGRGDGLEVRLSEESLVESLDELEGRLAEQPTFYRGASAVANFGAALPSSDEVERLRALLGSAEIVLRALRGSASGLEELAQAAGLAYEPYQAGELQRRRALRPRGDLRLSEAARSLVADFAGARTDIAARRQRGEASVPRPVVEPAAAARPLRVVEAPPGTLYHAATLRGGQTLHHNGNIVVVGDVNPGAELVATGDILVFGRLAGIAHAGARGDENARIYAIDLAATQLRIATFIATEGESKRPAAKTAEMAVARDGGIAILPLDRLADLGGTGTPA
jgi:septum site-determining protein MinC